MKKEKEELEEPSAPFWMVTYGDMVTLLLTFFVLIVSFSAIELEKFKGAMESLKGALGVLPAHESPQKREFIDFDQGVNLKRVDLLNRLKGMETVFKEQDVNEMIKVSMGESGMHIRLGDKVLFDPGKADLKPQAYPILSVIAKTVKGAFTEIYVEGHTDNVPIRTERFPSNWELSSARALSVVRYLYTVEKIPEKYLAAVGHGEHRPIVPNTSAKNRAKNRRVEIFIKLED